jgi:hypothetical protein
MSTYATNRDIRRDAETLLSEAGVIIFKQWDEVTREWIWWAHRHGHKWSGGETQYSYADAVGYALFALLADAGVIKVED